MAKPTERQLKIAEFRRRGDSQEAIAEKLGIARSTVARDWSAIKQEMSYLPLDWSAPSIILPARKISKTDSAAVFVSLDSLTFERLRKSTALYGSDPDGQGQIFEFREMSIVHALDMKGIPVKLYPEIIHLILKHECDVISRFDLIKSIINGISSRVSYSDFPRIDWDMGGKNPAFKSSLSRWNGEKGSMNGRLAELDIDDEKLQFILEEINAQWGLEHQRLCEEILAIIGPHLNFSSRWEDPSSEFDYENKDRGDYSLLLDAFNQTIEDPELLERWRVYYQVKGLDKSAFWNTRFRNQLLMHLGILEADIPLAYAHKICSPVLLESFMQSGAEDLKEYNALKQQGFKTVEDKEDYQLIKDDIEPLQAQGWLNQAKFGDITGSEVLEKLRLEGWNEDTLKSCIRVKNQFGINIPYAGGHAIAEQWLLFEIPESELEITNIKKLIENVPKTYASWIFLNYNPKLIAYALQSGESLEYPNAIVTYSALYKKGFSFADARNEHEMGRKGEWFGRFIQEHGLAWAESKYSPEQFAIMAILESSHQQQIAEVNLLEVINTRFRGMFPDNAAIENEISTNLADLCMIHSNGIVEYIANKGAIDFAKTDAISRHQESMANLANIQIIPKKQESVASVLKRLALDGKAIPGIVARIANNDTHAMRIARAIQSDDLEEATTVCWRFFVHEVHLHCGHQEVDQPTSEFVHMIDRVQEIVTLSKTEVNTLHSVRMIRNYVEHPDDDLSVKKQRPTWKKIATVLSICEKLQ